MSRQRDAEIQPSEAEKGDSAEPRCSNVSSSVREALESDPRLATLIEAWADLSEPIKAGIVAMTEAAR